MPADAQQPVGDGAQQPVLDREVGKRRKRRAELAEELASAQQPAPQRQTVAFSQPRFGDNVHLGDLNAVRADPRAHATDRAVVYRAVHRYGAPLPKALRLGADSLGAREQVGDRGHGAGGRANIALNAQVGGQGRVEHGEVVRGFGHVGRAESTGKVSSLTARQAVARSTPSRQPSPIRSAPAKRPPTAHMLGYAGSPPASSGSMASFTATPKRV